MLVVAVTNGAQAVVSVLDGLPPREYPGPHIGSHSKVLNVLDPNFMEGELKSTVFLGGLLRRGDLFRTAERRANGGLRCHQGATRSSEKTRLECSGKFFRFLVDVVVSGWRIKSRLCKVSFERYFQLTQHFLHQNIALAQSSRRNARSSSCVPGSLAPAPS